MLGNSLPFLLFWVSIMVTISEFFICCIITMFIGIFVGFLAGLDFSQFIEENIDNKGKEK